MINKITTISAIHIFFKLKMFFNINCSIINIIKFTIKANRDIAPAKAIPPLFSTNK